jgi:hypothetical protein
MALSTTLLLALTLAACGDDAAPGSDAGRIDSGRTDGGVRLDAGRDAAIALDAGPSDAGFDATVSDAGGPDAGEPDAGEPDAGEPDAGTDAGMADAAIPDAGDVTPDMLCLDVCDAIGACVGMVPPPSCAVKCAADLADCSASQLAAIDACRSGSCEPGPSGLPMLVECIAAVGCVSAGMM